MKVDRGVCIGIPAYNAQGTIGDVVRRALAHVPAVLVVDDGSRDGTAEAARAGGAEVLVMPENRGKGNALRVLLAEARRRGYSALLAMDADGQHDPGDIALFLDEHRRRPGALVIGSRMGAAEKIPPHRLSSMIVARFFISLAANRFLEDTQCGFRLYPLPLLERIALLRERYVTETEILIKVGDSGGEIRTVPARTLYPKGQPSHFRNIWDVAAITAYVISYLMVKWGIEGIRRGTRYTYRGRGTARDALAFLPLPELAFETVLIALSLPLTVLYGAACTVSKTLSLNVFEGWKGTGVPTWRIVAAALFLPLLLLIAIADRIVNVSGGRSTLSHRVVHAVYAFPPAAGAGGER